MFQFDGNSFVPLMIFAIPIVAIVGGITAGIVRTIGQQRLMELAQRERIAAIERGVDPSKLPPLPTVISDGTSGGGTMFMNYHDYAKRRSQNLMIGGLICLCVGIGLGIFLNFVGDAEDHHVWAVGLIPGGVGVALILSSLIVRPNADDRRSPPPPQNP